MVDNKESEYIEWEQKQMQLMSEGKTAYPAVQEQ